MKNKYKWLIIILLIPVLFGFLSSPFRPWWGLREQTSAPDTPSDGGKLWVDSNNNLFYLGEDGSSTQLDSSGSLSDPTTIGTLSLGSASITDSSGTIAFGNENLSTTGTLDLGADDDISTLTMHDAGSITLYDDSDDVTVYLKNSGDAGSGKLSFYDTNDIEFITFDAENKRIGIRNNAPAVDLSIKRTTGVDTEIKLENSGGSLRLVNYQDGAGYIGTGANDKLYLMSNNNSSIVIEPTWEVGIGGTATQNVQLDVYDNYRSGFTDIARFRRNISGTIRGIKIIGDTSGTYFDTITTHNIRFYANGSERMSIQEDHIYIDTGNGDLKINTYNESVADDANIVLPSFTNGCKGWVMIGNAEEYTEFWVDNDGDVTLVDGSANVVAGADTDAKVCIGTSATQEPLVVKNRLGGAKNFLMEIKYN